LAITGSTDVVGLGAADVVVVDGAAVVVVAELAALDDFAVSPAAPLLVQAPSADNATSMAAYGRRVRPRKKLSRAVIGVPCRSSIIVRSGHESVAPRRP